MAKVGVFLDAEAGLHVHEVASLLLREIPEVVHAEAREDLLTEQGLRALKERIQEKGLDRVLIAAASPEKYAPIFRKVAREANLNPYLLEVVSLREVLAGVFEDPAVATLVAAEQLHMAVKRLLYGEPLEARRIRGEKRVLIIGGGPAGALAADALEAAGYQVILVEEGPILGGMVMQLSKLYPDLEDAEATWVPYLMDLLQRENIQVYDYTEVLEVRGFLGNLDVRLRRKARLVRPMPEDALEKAVEACPVEVPDPLTGGLEKRKAIYLPHPRGVPRLPLIDRKACLRFVGKDEEERSCRLCQEAAGADYVDYEEKDREVVERVGAVVLATGARPMDVRDFAELPWDEEGVLDAVQMEYRLKQSAEGQPLAQEFRGAIWVAGAGSVERARGKTYGTEIPLMIAAKQALQVRELYPEARLAILYDERRAHSKGYLRFLERAEREANVQLIRAKVARVTRDAGGLQVEALHTTLGEKIQLAATLLIVVPEFEATEGTRRMMQVLGLREDPEGFVQVRHPWRAPLDTELEGVFVLGGARAPADLKELAVQAAGVAGRVAAELPEEGRTAEPFLAELVRPEECTGCMDCARICPYNAVEKVPSPFAEGRWIARIVEEACTGCGLCVPVCTPRVLELRGQWSRQLEAEVKVLWSQAG